MRRGIKEQCKSIFCNEPDITTRAAYVLLVVKLVKQESSYYNPRRFGRIKNRFINSISKINSSIQCEYCGKPNLVNDGNNTHNSLTIDHYEPYSICHNFYDRKNFVVSCFDCNQNYANAPSIHKVIKYPLKRCSIETK
jgi:5-methylcytosine-specific restriction endonuclease McrA